MPLPKPMSGAEFDQIAYDAHMRRVAAAETAPGITNILAHAGVPRAAAAVLADTIVTLRSCIDQQAAMIHDLQGRVNALDITPPHLPKREKRG